MKVTSNIYTTCYSYHISPTEVNETSDNIADC